MEVAEILEGLLETLGEAETVALAGLAVGLVFGVAAQRSRFCLRASVVEFARGRLGPRMAVWLLCFATALLWTQALIFAGEIDLAESRWLGQPGSVSGAVLGGLVFGAGMVLARGCPGRLLVLAATGNLRAILSGLVFAVAAQMSLHGLLAGPRGRLAAEIVTPGPNPDLAAAAGLPGWAGIALGAGFTLAALWLAWRNRVSARLLVFGSGVGFAAAAGWWITHALAGLTFAPTPVESLTFSGPSADMLIYVLTPAPALDFDIGLVPGVFLGAFLAALAAGELEWQGWAGVRSMQRSLTGAALMGFGAMLAGGCSIGAGVSGGSALALTAWLALAAMWAGGALTDALLDRREEAAAARGT
ncbi:YeeE/YedE family protein [Paralimibaculum aggregatum]|nr:YeeE/YedE family protein [Limibaculum sp. NKW23]